MKIIFSKTKIFTWLSVFISMFLSACGQSYPKKMPEDFTIRLGSSGGMTGLADYTFLSLDSCIYEKTRVQTIITRKKWKCVTAELEQLYQALKKIHAFDIKTISNNDRLYDGSSQSLNFIVNKKEYHISVSGNSVVLKKQKQSYRQMLALIVAFRKSAAGR